MLGPRSSSRTKSRWTRGFWSWHPHNPSNDAKIAPDFFQRPLPLPQEKAGNAREQQKRPGMDEWPSSIIDGKPVTIVTFFQILLLFSNRPELQPNK